MQFIQSATHPGVDFPRFLAQNPWKKTSEYWNKKMQNFAIKKTLEK
jgi:hypothetical protein